MSLILLKEKNQLRYRSLGYCIGNALEVAEAVSTLRGEGPKDLTDVCVELAATMVFLAGLGEMDGCRVGADSPT